ncbi:prealbumin-like fold domain-containing protein [Streptomyces sp. NPDC050485]|uniref:prealbumin-like fold domain-containing protein n=1 Tax=Streptomyces sp. NPDC050485 TaxID=3365617 RepID=UPI0037B23F79
MSTTPMRIPSAQRFALTTSAALTALIAGALLAPNSAAAADRDGHEARGVGWQLRTGQHTAFWSGTHVLDNGSPALCLDVNLYGPLDGTTNGYKKSDAPHQLSQDTQSQLAYLAAHYGKLPDTTSGRNSTAAASLLAWALAARDGVDENGYNGEKIPWAAWLTNGMPTGAVMGTGADAKIDTKPVITEFNRMRTETRAVSSAPYALTVPNTGHTLPYERTPGEKNLTVKITQGGKPVPGVSVNTTSLTNIATPKTPGPVGRTDPQGQTVYAFTPAKPGAPAGAAFSADITVDSPTFWHTDKQVSGKPMQRMVYFAAEKKTLTTSGDIQFQPQAIVTAWKKDRDTNKPITSPATYEIHTGKTPSEPGKDKPASKDTPGEIITTVTTGKDGKSAPVDLAAGVYWLVETKAPEGYQLNTEPTRVEVKPGEQTVVTVLDTAVPKPVTPTTPPVTPTAPASPKPSAPTQPVSPSMPHVAPPAANATPPAGELAHTGADATTWVAAAAGALLLLGGAALVIARRRRTARTK